MYFLLKYIQVASFLFVLYLPFLWKSRIPFYFTFIYWFWDSANINRIPVHTCRITCEGTVEVYGKLCFLMHNPSLRCVLHFLCCSKPSRSTWWSANNTWRNKAKVYWYMFWHSLESSKHTVKSLRLSKWQDTNELWVKQPLQAGFTQAMREYPFRKDCIEVSWKSAIGSNSCIILDKP